MVFHAFLAKKSQLIRLFQGVLGQCALCTADKEIFIFKPEFATLNTRNELGTHCMHKKSKLLYKKTKIKDKI